VDSKLMQELKTHCELDVRDCGLMDYHEALALQRKSVEQRTEDLIADTVLILEHQPAITMGARRDLNKLLVTEDALTQSGIELARVRRGGGCTAHNPGQVVLYPVIKLRPLGLGANGYIRKLEAIGLELLQQLEVKAQRCKGFPGLWVGERKIASIGVRIQRGVTSHGMAININNDLSIFETIVPCGLQGVRITNVAKETGREYPMAQVKQRLADLCFKHLAGLNTDSPDRRPISASATKLPPWLKRPLGAGQNYNRTRDVLATFGLETICTNANCPNIGECWARGTATVLILGNVCTRNCRFCSVAAGKPDPPDTDEPRRVVQMAGQLKLKYLVITSVNRDDLPDGGAGHFRDVVNRCHRQNPALRLELLVPDFRHCQDKAIAILGQAMPFVFGHNVETVPSLYHKVRPGADYKLSLALLRKAKQKYPDIQTKSSIMLGLGESQTEVISVLKDLRQAQCDRIAIGQYLRPGKDAVGVAEFIHPDKFRWWHQEARRLGFSWVMASPFTRSSFGAGQEYTDNIPTTLNIS
jgi:lipoic acid synthetase